MTSSMFVIIPFYQREAGILSKALKSIAIQKANVDLTVLVIDDSSPVNPEYEIAIADTKLPIEVIRIPNSGPGLARNIGIDIAHSRNADLIAFLDSDDEWKSDHIRTALTALSFGNDFYFCETERVTENGLDEGVQFSSIWPVEARPKAIEVLSAEDELYTMTSAVAFTEFVRSYLGQTSTIVFDARVHRHARFHDGLRSAGEDHMMWLQMISKSASVSFCTKPNVVCGRGVNIYFSAMDWRIPATRDRYGYLTMFYMLLLREFKLNADEKHYVQSKVSENAIMFSYLTLKHAVRWNFPPRSLIRGLNSLDYKIVLKLPFAASRRFSLRNAA